MVTIQIWERINFDFRSLDRFYLHHQSMISNERGPLHEPFLSLRVLKSSG